MVRSFPILARCPALNAALGRAVRLGRHFPVCQLIASGGVQVRFVGNDLGYLGF